MKKIVLAIVALFAMSSMATAQIQDLGVRIGGGQGYGAELSAMAGQVGLEYNFDAIPFQLTLDIRPQFWVLPDMDDRFQWGDIALGIRYRF